MAENMSIPGKTGIWKKRIPTFVGLILLIVALVAGTMFFQDGLGVFSPRATAETTPKKVRVTNVSDSGFTISFITEEAVSSFVEYGTSADKLEKTQSDARDQLSGTVGDFKTHYINVVGLEPNSTYYYVIGTGGGAKFDNEGTAFQITTARRNTPAPAKTVYGSVTTESGAPADGALVYLAIDGAGELSSLIKSSGSWAIPLSNARTIDKSAYFEISDDTLLEILVQGPEAERKASASIKVKDARPVPTLAYGQTELPPQIEKKEENSELATNSDQSETEENALAQGTEESAPESIELEEVNSPATSGAEMANHNETNAGDATAKLAEAERTLEVFVDASASGITETPVIKSTQPIISGKAAASVVVDIEINSDTKITQQLVANDDGSFSLDIAALSQELEPGEHSVTYSYIDPSTGEKVTKTQTFIVEGDVDTQLAQANTSTATPLPTPYSSENPYPIGNATQSATSNPLASPLASVTPSPDQLSGTESGSRTSMPSTDSGVPVSGSIGTTLALIFGGLFFITSGAWSFWASKQYSK